MQKRQPEESKEEGRRRRVALRLSDVVRATLGGGCGNVGFIGISPDGSRYHVVVPVDRKISRGLKFWEEPADGTPFGGYKCWHYALCPSYAEQLEDPLADRKARLARAKENGRLLRAWAEGMNMEVEIVEDMG